MITGAFEKLREVVEKSGRRAVVLQNARGRALVVPELGGRLLSVNIDGMECLWVDPELRHGTWSGNWNAGGQRTWIAPERGGPELYFAGGAWQCPPAMDPGEFRVESVTGDSQVRMKASFFAGAPGHGARFSVERTVALTDRADIPFPPLFWKGDVVPPTLQTTRRFSLQVGQKVSFSGAPRGMFAGAWSILQLPAPGCAVVFTDEQRARPPYYRDNFFNPMPREWRHAGDGPLIFRLTGTRQVKVGVPADAFPSLVDVQYFHRDAPLDLWLVTLQRFRHTPGDFYVESADGRPSPRGDIVQLYSHFTADENTYAELEAHGPAALRDGEVSDLTVDYEFHWFRGDGAVQDLVSQNLLAFR